MTNWFSNLFNIFSTIFSISYQRVFLPPIPFCSYHIFNPYNSSHPPIISVFVCFLSTDNLFVSILSRSSIDITREIEVSGFLIPSMIYMYNYAKMPPQTIPKKQKLMKIILFPRLRFSTLLLLSAFQLLYILQGFTY